MAYYGVCRYIPQEKPEICVSCVLNFASCLIVQVAFLEDNSAFVSHFAHSFVFRTAGLDLSFRDCLHGGGAPEIDEVT